MVLVALLTGLTAGSSWLVARHFRNEAVTASRLYAAAFRGLADPDPGAANSALLDVGARIRSLGLPLIYTDTAGRVTQTANLPFGAAPTGAAMQRYIVSLDALNAPIATPGYGAVHYGAIPQTRLLTALGALQGATILIMVTVAVMAYRNASTAQRDRMWVAMAREAAHQMGTPLTSMQGWIEQLRSAGVPPRRVGEFLDADAERLQRVAQRFERIGNPARRDSVALGALAERVASYFRPRLPHHANAIVLSVRAASAGPVIAGDPVLLEWALEAMVKNAIDALQGRGGHITLAVESTDGNALVRVIDDGPGIPREIRRTLFHAGVTTKRGGWGIGLALARRVIEDAHQGTLAIEPTHRGTTFLLRLPLATPA